MARQTLTAQTIGRGGLGATYAAVVAADGAQFAYDGDTNVFLHCKNTGGSPVVVTLPLGQTVDGQAPASRTVSVPATTGERFVGPFPLAYRQSDSNVYVNVDGNLSVAVLKLPQS